MYRFSSVQLLLEVFKLEHLRLVILLEQLIILFRASYTGLDLLVLSPNLCVIDANPPMLVICILSILRASCTLGDKVE